MPVSIPKGWYLMKSAKKLFSLTNVHLFCLFCLSIFYFVSSLIYKYSKEDASEIEEFINIYFITFLMLIFLNLLNALRFYTSVKNKRFNDSYMSLFTGIFSLILTVAGTSIFIQKISLFP